MSKNRIQYIDLLKGIACICIFWGHFNYVLYSKVDAGDACGQIIIFVNSIVRWFLNGPMMVSLFCVISGYFISWKIDSIRNVIKYCIKRYLRLTIPVFIISVICWLLYTFVGLDTNTYIANYFNNDWLLPVGVKTGGLAELVFNGLFGIVVIGREYMWLPTWMLHHMLYGQILLAIFSYLINKLHIKKEVLLISMIIITIAVGALRGYVTFAVLIGGLYKYYKENYKSKFNSLKRYIAESILLLCFVIIGFFTTTEKLNSIGPILFSLGMLLLVDVLSFFCKSTKPSRLCKFSGEISFGVYLLHMPSIIFIALPILRYCIDKSSVSYNIAYAISLLTTFVSIIILSYIWSITADKLTNTMINKIFKPISTKST
ncbi:MAG: acyltransferase [Saccharofermentans sp.]|nr:acyltransferase [Saccharofermentans sp.]